MRTRFIGPAATAAITAGISVTTAAPAHASGWGTISTSTVNTSLTTTSWTLLGRSFKPAQRLAYEG